MAVSAAFRDPLFWVILALLALLLLGIAWRLRLRWRPAWALRLLLAMLALAGVFLPRGQQPGSERPAWQAMVIDQSDSLSPAARIGIQQQALTWQSGGENRLIVAFGAHPKTVLEPGQPWPILDGRASNLASALDRAGELLGSLPGRVLLASDGGAADSTAVQGAVSRLARQGHALDVLPLEVRSDPGDGFVGPLWAAANLWAGVEFDVMIPVHPPPDAGDPVLRLKINGQDSGLAAESLGGNLFRFRVPEQNRGLLTLEATAEFTPSAPALDPFPQNNAAFAALQVFAPPHVLFVTPQPTAPAAGRFVQQLAQNGLEIDTLPPELIPIDLDGLGRYRVIFLHNLLSSQLSQEQMLALQVFVSRLGGGLVFMGGRSSYTLGGYRDTLLEPLLPVRLEPPARSERPPIVFLLILDRSASMGSGSTPDDPAPIALAREAALRAIEAMQPRDWLGVLTFSDESTWEVPLRELGGGLDLRAALDAVNRVEATGTTYMFSAMQAGLAALGALPEAAPAARHLLVLSDGQSFDGSLEEFSALAQAAQAQGVTLSSIAFGEDADEETMAALAEAGNGRYYRVSQAEELPRIMVYESQAARSENIQAGETALRLADPEHPVLSGIRPGDLPALNGYNALSSRVEEGAEDVLVSASFGDPVLSVWQYELGRVVAWTGDLGEEWAGEWAPGIESRFWSQVVRYALPNPAFGPGQVNVQVQDTQLVVETALAAASGDPLNLAEVIFTYADPAGQAHAFSVPQTEAGVYRLVLPRPSEGAYRGVLAYSITSGQRVEIPAPFAVNPPAEWLPLDPAAGRQNLASWAAAARGRVFAAGELAVLAGSELPQEKGSGLAWQPLLLALILLWPLEIALRRRWLPWP